MMKHSDVVAGVPLLAYWRAFCTCWTNTYC